MRVRPGHVRREGGARLASRLRRMRARSRSGGGRRRTTRSGTTRLQRSLVKVSYAKNRKPGSWRAHGRYLSREGAQRERGKGLGFDAEGDASDIAVRLDGWQKQDDRHLWKLVLSPESGDRIDLKQHTRDLLTELEIELGTKLEWVAIDHYNTAHPHVHVALRGVDERGKALRLDRAQLSRIRELSRHLATRELGYRTEHDAALARERGVEAQHWTELDRGLERRAGGTPGRIISFEGPVPAHPRAFERRLQELRRLAFLQTMGLAERVSAHRWKLAEELEGTLRRLQLARDIVRSRNRAQTRELLADPHAATAITHLQPGVEVRGRVVGTTLEERSEQPFLVVEGTDGRVHFIPQTRGIERARGEGRLQPGQLVTLRGREFERDGRLIPWTQIEEHGSLEELERVPEPSTVLDLDAVRTVRQTGRLPEPEPARRGFFARWRAAVVGRRTVLERARVLFERAGSDQEREPRKLEVAEGAEQMIEARMHERERAPISLQDAERRAGKPIQVASEQAGRLYRGRIVAYAEGEDGTRYAVLETGRNLTAVPTREVEIAAGRLVEARSRSLEVEEEGEERRALAWQLEEIEREQRKERGRGR